MPPPTNDRQQVTGKQRASRMPLDYYKKSDAIESAKNWLSAAAVVVVLGAWLVLWLSPWPWGEKLHSRGDVAAVHATWDKECSACHDDFVPISQDASWAVGLSGGRNASDAQCRRCHAGPDHHASQMSTMTPACAHCHRDHQGRNFDLKRVTDAFCTGCHADLRNATEYKFRDLARSYEPFANRVTRFDGDHPDFRSLKGDPGRLRFNHKLHLSLGMQTPERGHPQFKLSKVEPSQQNRYRVYEGKDGLIQLDCGACHQLETADFGLDAMQLAGVPLAGLPQRAAGAYFLPIVYENQCKACHPLSFERKNADDPQSGMKSVPHGWQPSQIHEMLQGHYTAEFLKGNLPSFQGPVKLPGKDATPGGSLKLKADEYIQRLVAKAEHDLFASQRSCAECHYPEPKEPPAGDWSKVRIAPPNVPQIWLKHARFDHAAHRAMKCTDCHADPQTSTSEKSVLIPNRDNCLQCHTAPGLLSSQGRARTDCAECHRYHNGDHGGMLQGIGASSRGVKSQLDVKSFLQGGP